MKKTLLILLTVLSLSAFGGYEMDQSGEHFANPYVKQIVDFDLSIVCYARSSYSEGKLSCVKYDVSKINRNGSVEIDIVSKPVFHIRVKDTIRRVVCYTIDGTSSKEAHMTCMKY